MWESAGRCYSRGTTAAAAAALATESPITARGGPGCRGLGHTLSTPPPSWRDRKAPRLSSPGSTRREPNGSEASSSAGGHDGSYGLADLESKPREELEALAEAFGAAALNQLRTPELVFLVLKLQAERQGNVLASGVLDLVEDGVGYLLQNRFMSGPSDVYVSQSQIRRFSLRTGDWVTGHVRPPKDAEKYFSLLRVVAVNGREPEIAHQRPHFDALTPIFPQERLVLETDAQSVTQRLIDLIAPIGKGQRGLIVSPPKAGKTTILKHIANGVTANYPEVHLMAVLVGERAEEVTDFERSVRAEVVSSTFDERVEHHTAIAEMALHRAKRLVETGCDVVLLLDSITRLTRAYNLTVPSSGRTLSGGVDPAALYRPKQFFSAARKIEEGGSLTILATCLVDTGSRMDELIYEEFKGTGNMELQLDRKLAERRVFPSVDLLHSGTRREELLLDAQTLRTVWALRRMLAQIGTGDSMELVLARLAKTPSNREFLATLSKGEA